MPVAIVVGGGIAGLSAAVALRQAGWRVSVHERAVTLEPLGAALSLWPNATAALARLSLLDAALAAEALGHAAAPMPFLGSIVMATQAFISSATQAQQDKYLPMLAAGECRFAVALPGFAGQTGSSSVQRADGRLSGNITGVADAGAATHVLVYLPDGHAAFAYAFDGDAIVAGTRLSTGDTAILSGDGAVELASDAGCRLLLVAGRPLGEPVFRAGPFAMASERDLEQAFDDIRSGRFLEPA